MTTVRSKLDKLTFSGKDDDFAFFGDQFEARMYVLKLDKVLLDKVVITEAVDKTDAAQVTKEQAERDDLAEKQYQVWCELIQCLQKEAGLMIRGCKGNGMEGWKVLRSHFRSTERPRIQQLLHDLTNLKLEASETVAQYLIRAEDMKLSLSEVGETISDQMLCSVVLKGLPRDFASFVTVVNYGNSATTFTSLKRDLLNYSNDINHNVSSSSFYSGGQSSAKCFTCRKPGHQKANCPEKNKGVVCFTCNKPGHYAKECKNGISCTNCKKPRHTYAQCFKEGGGAYKPKENSHVSKQLAYVDEGFSFMSTKGQTPQGCCELLIDSGCTGYMLKDKWLFSSLDTTHRGTVGNANASHSEIEGTGIAAFLVRDSSGNQRRIELKDAFYVPSYSRNLVGVKKLNDAGVRVLFGGEPCLEVQGTTFPVVEKAGLFLLQGEVCHAGVGCKSETLTRWHERLGHNNKNDIQLLEKKVEGMSISERDNEQCSSCDTQKAKRHAIKKTWGTRATKSLEIVHTDVLTMPVQSVDGFKYSIGFIDSYSRFNTVYFMRSRDEVFDKFQQYIADIGVPRTLVSDGAKEYVSHRFQGFCRERGVRHEVSAPYTPEDNGKSERIWSTIIGMTKCMLDRAGMDKSYWSYAMKAAFHVKNICIHSSHGKTPHEQFFSEKPDVSGIRVFGCKVYVFVEQRFRKKLDSTAVEGVFLGYDPYCLAYLVGLPNDSKAGFRILQTRNVKFDEEAFFFAPMASGVSGGTLDFIGAPSQEEIGQEVTETHDLPDESSESETEELEAPRRSGRVRRPPQWMEDYIDGEGFSSHVDTVIVPKNATIALADPKWKDAMTKEHESLMQNDVWELVELPKGRTAVGGMWTFAVKRGSSGEVLRYKARYVAKGYSQIYGQDYDETYSPTVKLSTVRCILACAAQEKCNVDQLDIKTAFLNAPIEEEVYVCQPVGFQEMGSGGTTLYCKLKKSLYGLKQAGRNWYLTISDYLKLLGFKESIYDHCLFVNCMDQKRSYVCIWVDDLIYFSTDPEFSSTFRSQITQKFDISDQSKLSWFLGMKVDIDADGSISLSQKQYICDLLDKFGMSDCKALSSPGPEKVSLTKADCPEPESDEHRQMKENDYRSLVGSLNYLSNTTRPDLSFVSGALSSFLNNPGLAHWTFAKHVLRYLKGTSELKLTYRSDSDGIRLVGYSDADYGGHIDSRRSTSGYCFSVQKSSGVISWRSKLQTTVALSTAESELSAATAGAQEAAHLCGILGDLGWPQTPPMTLFCDNQAAIAMSRNPIQHGKTKHFAIKLSYLRELCAEQFLVLEYLSTDNMPADIFTKCLGRLKTVQFCNMILGHLSAAND